MKEQRARGTSRIAHTEGAGPDGPIVLLHGWAADSRIWAPLMAKLRGRVKSLAPDLPGHGETDLHVPAGATVSEAAVEAFAEWCSEHHVAQAPMVGWAWGSQVLTSAMNEGLVQPRSVLLISHVVDPATPDPYSGPLSRDWPRYVRAVVRVLTASPLSVESEVWLSTIMSSSSIAAAGGVHAGQLPSPSQEFRLPPDSRALLGADDRIVDPEVVKTCIEGWGGELVSTPGVGHIPFLERPDEFERELYSWLERIGVVDASSA